VDNYVINADCVKPWGCIFFASDLWVQC